MSFGDVFLRSLMTQMAIKSLVAAAVISLMPVCSYWRPKGKKCGQEDAACIIRARAFKYFLPCWVKK
jgi:hypothetical protein